MAESSEPEHLRRGRTGDAAARAQLAAAGLRFIAANFRDPRGGRGEIDVIFRDGDCLLFEAPTEAQPGHWARSKSKSKTAKFQKEQF